MSLLLLLFAETFWAFAEKVIVFFEQMASADQGKVLVNVRSHDLFALLNIPQGNKLRPVDTHTER
jgi:hypothetical protein